MGARRRAAHRRDIAERRAAARAAALRHDAGRPRNWPPHPAFPRIAAISPRGAGSISAALTEAAALVERTIREAAPDLVILNKFGKAEAEEGGGLRDAIVAAIEADVPVLIGVAEEYRGALSQFAGDLCLIAADEAEVRRWLRARFGERAAPIVA